MDWLQTSAEFLRNFAWYIWPLIAGGASGILAKQTQGDRVVDEYDSKINRERKAGGYVWRQWLEDIKVNELEIRSRLTAWMVEAEDKALRMELKSLIDGCDRNLAMIDRMMNFRGGD